MQLLSAVQPTMSTQAQFAFITHLMDLLGLSLCIVEKSTLSPLESYYTHLQSFQIVSCRLCSPWSPLEGAQVLEANERIRIILGEAATFGIHNKVQALAYLGSTFSRTA